MSDVKRPSISMKRLLALSGNFMAIHLLVVVRFVIVVISSSSHEYSPALLSGILDAVLVIAVAVWISRSATCAGFSQFRILGGLGAIWSAMWAISLLVHRATPAAPQDLLTHFVTFGLHPRQVAPSGMEDGWILLVIGFLHLISNAHRNRRGSDRQIPEGLRAVGSSRSILFALATMGVFSFGRSVFDLIARQHVERVSTDSSSGAVVEMLGPILPTAAWTFVASGLLGILVLMPIYGLLSRRSRPKKNSSEVPDFSTDHSALFGIDFMAAAVWVTALAFWVRVSTLLTVAPTRTDGGDPLFYHVTANLLARGRGFPEPLNFIAFQRWIPSALHGPAYPIVLSISSRLGGTTFFDHKIVSILIGSAVVFVTMLLTHRIAPTPSKTPTAIMAGLLAAIYPNLWLVDGVLFPEGLMALFTLGVVYCAYSWWDGPRVGSAAAMGLLLAASALTRGEGLLLSVLLVVPLVLSARRLSFRSRLKHLCVAGTTSLIVIAPWSIRNAQSFETFVPLSTNGNELFVYANCPAAYEGKFLGFWLFQCQEDLRSIEGEPEGDESEKALYWRQKGIDYARDNAEDIPRVLAARIGRQWEFFRGWQNTEFAPIEGRNKDAARIGLFMYFAMIPAAIQGLRILRRAKVRLLPIVSVFASVTLTAAYAYGTTRFRVPFEPLLCVLAALGLVHALSRIRRRWPPSSEWVRANALGSLGRRPSFVLGGSPNMRSMFHRSALSAWISALAVASAMTASLPALYRAVGSSMEEGFMLVFPELVLKGKVPNVDFLHLYGPTSLYTLAGWFHLFGANLVAERSFGLLQHVAFVAGLMVLTRPWGRLVSTFVGLVSLVFVLTPVGLQALAWNGALALALWAVIFALRASRIQQRSTWIVSGIFSGLAVGFRPDIVLAISLSIGILLLRRSRSSILPFVTGAISGLFPVLIHVMRAGVPAVFEGMVLDPVFRLRAGRSLPQPPSLSNLDGALQVIAEKFAPWWGLPHLSAPKQLFVWFFLLPIIALTVASIARAIPSHRPERIVLLCGSAFGIGLLPQAVQRPDSAHFLWVSAVVFPLAIVAAREWVSARAPRTHPWRSAMTGLLVVFALILTVIPFYTIRTYGDLVVRSATGQLEVREVRRDDRVFYLGDERPWRATLEVVADLDKFARAGERLFVGPVDLRQTAYSDAFFYHLFPELEPATYYIEMDPGIANQDTRLADDVSSADWLILTRFWSGWIEPNASIEFGLDEPNQIVERFFCLRGSYQNDLVRLYEHCERGDGIGPYEGPYKPEYDYAVEVLVPVPPRPDGTCTPTCQGKPSSTGIEIGIDTSVVE